MDKPGVHQDPEHGGEQRKGEDAGSEEICGTSTIPAVREYVKVKEGVMTGTVYTCTLLHLLGQFHCCILALM